MITSLKVANKKSSYLLSLPGLSYKDVYMRHDCLCLLVMLNSGDKLVRATELVKLLSLEKSVKGAIKLVTALKLPNLAERFNTILEVISLSIMRLHFSDYKSFSLERRIF